MEDYLNKIIQGDCLKIMRDMPDDSIDTIITDPVWPNALPQLAGADDPWALFAEAAAHFPRLARTMVIHLGCTSDPRFLTAVPKELPYFRTCWLRYHFPSYRGRVLIGSDVAYAFGKPPPTRKGNHVLPGEAITKDTDMDISVWRKFHPCARKLDDVMWLVSVFSNPGEIVFDPFIGSGTTALAAQKLGCKFIGVEIDPKYCTIAEDRLRQEYLFAA